MHGSCNYIITSTSKINVLLINSLCAIFDLCLVDCGSLEDPDDGQVNFVDTFGGSVANYTCDELYVLCGVESRVCQSNGSWSGSPPDCIS